jgi:hypothetical protein
LSGRECDESEIAFEGVLYSGVWVADLEIQYGIQIL